MSDYGTTKHVPTATEQTALLGKYILRIVELPLKIYTSCHLLTKTGIIRNIPQNEFTTNLANKRRYLRKVAVWCKTQKSVA